MSVAENEAIDKIAPDMASIPEFMPLVRDQRNTEINGYNKKINKDIFGAYNNLQVETEELDYIRKRSIEAGQDPTQAAIEYAQKVNEANKKYFGGYTSDS
jgi:hypothetical protein